MMVEEEAGDAAAIGSHMKHALARHLVSGEMALRIAPPSCTLISPAAELEFTVRRYQKDAFWGMSLNSSSFTAEAGGFFRLHHAGLVYISPSLCTDLIGI